MLLRDLDYFIQIAERGSFHAAAVQFDVTQPAITKGIQRLEAELGLSLLERSSHGTRLTEAGVAFLRRARRLRRDLNDTLREADDLRARATGLLRVGVAPTLVAPFFRSASMRVIAQRPAVRFALRIALSDALFTGLRRRDLDVVISTIPGNMPAFDVHPIGYSDLVVVACRRHPVRALRAPGLASLADCGWILPRRGVMARDWIDGVFTRADLAPPVARIEIDTHTNQLLDTLPGTELLSVATTDVLASQARDLAPLPHDDLRWHRRIGALTRRNDDLSPLGRHFVDVLQDSSPSARPHPGPDTPLCPAA